MRAADLIETVKAGGVALTLTTSGTVEARGDEAAVSLWLPIIREHKADIIEALRLAEPATLEPAPPRVPTLGSRLSWTRADGSIQTGVIDDLHTDETGTVWAFITLPGGSWTAVNLKFATPGAA